MLGKRTVEILIDLCSKRFPESSSLELKYFKNSFIIVLYFYNFCILYLSVLKFTVHIGKLSIMIGMHVCRSIATWV